MVKISSLEELIDLESKFSPILGVKAGVRQAQTSRGTPRAPGVPRGVNNRRFVELVAGKAEVSKKQAAKVIEATFESAARVVKRDKQFKVPGFGTFTVHSRKARKGRNPQTGAEITIKASRTVGFKPAPSLKKGL